MAPGTMSPAQSILQRILMGQDVEVVPRVLFCSNAGLWISSQRYLPALCASEPMYNYVCTHIMEDFPPLYYTTASTW